MDWRDDGIVLSLRKHGESGAIAALLTRDHGRHAGLVRGARSAKLRGVLQPGNLVRADWRARLAEHLGHFTIEALEARVAPLLTSPGRLAALTSACALLDIALPERAPVPEIYDLTDALTERLADDDWAEAYVKWEAALLAALGFGLDLNACAATGVTDDLIFVSPKSGRAVSREAGAPYKERLLRLPGFLLPRPQTAPPTPEDVVRGLRLTGYFLNEQVARPGGQTLPDARSRLASMMDRDATR
ncbi:MAG: DNA repair protein RecO [Alphaproteobacteria bacterium]|nr:DNA repair protein RecO [Alphaproteobacteria bacterium]